LAATLALDPLLNAIGGTFTNLVVNSVWAVGDIVMLAPLVGIVALCDWRPGRGLWLVLAGFALLAAADVIYLVQVTASGGYAVGVGRDSSSPAALLLVAAGAWAPTRPAARTRPANLGLPLAPLGFGL